MDSSERDRAPPTPAQRSGDPFSVAFDVKDAVDYSGGLTPFRHAAGAVASRAAPIALGVLGAAGGVPLGMAVGSVIPQAAKSLYDALPLPQNRDTPIRQAGAGYRQDFYNNLNRGNYGYAARDALMASGMTLGQFLNDLPPPVPRRQQ